jgi:hypothetical protein
MGVVAAHHINPNIVHIIMLLAFFVLSMLLYNGVIVKIVGIFTYI